MIFFVCRCGGNPALELPEKSIASRDDAGDADEKFVQGDLGDLCNLGDLF
jgi:hypothetical protein